MLPPFDKFVIIAKLHFKHYKDFFQWELLLFCFKQQIAFGNFFFTAAFFFFFFVHSRLLPGTRSPAVGPAPCGVQVQHLK